MKKSNNNIIATLSIIGMIIISVIFCILLSISGDKKSSNQTEIASNEAAQIEESSTSTSKNDDTQQTESSYDNENKITKLIAEYSGSTKKGTVLDENNEDITVIAVYDNGDKYQIEDYTIQNPAKLKAGKTSTIVIEYENATCKLKVKCTSLTASQYKKKCKSISYKKLARKPDKYEGKKVKFTGKIIQVMEDDYETCFRIDVTRGKYGVWDDTVYVEFYGDSNKRFLEDDIVTFYGEFNGLHTYESIFGASITIPSVEAKYITLKS